MLNIWFGFVGFYGISTIIGYLMPNPLSIYIYIYILNIWFVNTFCTYMHHGNHREKKKKKKNSNYPRTPPFSPTSENVPKLKEWLLERFATTVFNSSGKFPAMSGPPAHIHLKEWTGQCVHIGISQCAINSSFIEDWFTLVLALLKTLLLA